MRHTYKEFARAVGKYGLIVTERELYFIQRYPDEVNGCGRRGQWYIPDTLLFIIEFFWACYIHDAGWAVALNRGELEEANARFTKNLKQIADRCSRFKIIAAVVRQFVAVYTSAVDLVGIDDECEKRGWV